MKSISPGELHTVVERIVSAVGTPPANAILMADHLVGSHLAGHDSHGVQHPARYVSEVRSGQIVPDAMPEIAYRRSPGRSWSRATGPGARSPPTT